MEPNMKECMLYLPVIAELGRVEIGVDNDATIEPIANPFRHRIIFFGSSFTHGISASHSGMSYLAQLERATGLNCINLGVTGNAEMQEAYADILCDATADAFVFDCFSNPDAATIRERLMPFIKRLRQAHPTTPLIFMQTIHRENCNFSRWMAQSENDKRDVSVPLMRKAVKEFNDVYFIECPFTGDDHETTADGVHPSDLGYWRWAQALKPLLLEILAKYGIE